MSKHNTSRATRYLPQVAVATMAVAVLPVVVVWLLLAEGVIASPWACVGLAVALSLTASVAGSTYWKRRGGHGDVLFSELLVWGWLHRFRSERRLDNAIQLLGLADAQQGLSESEESVERKAQILRQMAAALDAQDPYTDGHSRRVALHAAMVARRIGLSREEVAKVRTAAAVHDIGKLRIPAEVLNKPGPLSAAEFEAVKRHADEGADIVSCMQDPEITAMVRHHHERFDGTGYPGGLLGVQTPVGARIIAVADTFDALTSARPYRAAIPHRDALETIQTVSGSQLDPVAVRAFLKCYSGKRALIFWTLLAVSPQRAFAFVGGKQMGRLNLGTAATVAMPTALAAVVAAAFGSAENLGNAHSSQRLAQQGSTQTARTHSHHGTRSHRGASPQLLAAVGGLSRPAKHAVLAVSFIRGSRVVGNHSAGGSKGGSATPGGGGSGGGRGGGSRTGGGGVTLKPPKRGGGGVSTPGSSGTKPPTGSGKPPTKPPKGPGGGPGGGGQGGGPTGGGTGSGGNGGGNGPGGGSGDPLIPPSKEACKNNGWISLGYPNQGQCVAAYEHSIH